ncbi:MAG: flavin-dependent oxidoreductase, F420-dependent methylene-tetrahydromethanopterin reductase [Actinomycetia bacterium]|nr:flavin-dependent oxidoreductase, F420-dependent methylene-tetrahydromethanopterin reductase [Actinomycetes bacterium]
MEHVRLAEDLGYARAWMWDSPALYGDVWMHLALAAAATERIGLGPAVLVPSLRHVLVNASALATLEQLAPGRAAAAVGTGFTGRMVLGQAPMTWKDTGAYIAQLRGLLRGEAVEIDGRLVQMVMDPGVLPERPLPTPIVVAANGPKGLAVAQEHGDGVMAVFGGVPDFDWCALLQYGTVLEPGEPADSARVLDAAGPGAVVAYHGIYEAAPSMVDEMEGGEAWRADLESIPEVERHLALHRGHFTAVSERDRKLVSGDSVLQYTMTGDASEWRTKAEALAETGVTELIYAPMGADIPRELRAVAALGLA